MDGRFQNLVLRNNRTLEADDPPITVDELSRVIRQVKQKYLSEYRKFMYEPRGGRNASTCIAKMLEDPVLVQEEAEKKKKAAQAKAKAEEDGTPLPKNLEKPLTLEQTKALETRKASGRGLFLKRYTDHKVCADLPPRFVNEAVLNAVVDEHCMPAGINEPLR